MKFYLNSLTVKQHNIFLQHAFLIENRKAPKMGNYEYLLALYYILTEIRRYFIISFYEQLELILQNKNNYMRFQARL